MSDVENVINLDSDNEELDYNNEDVSDNEEQVNENRDLGSPSNKDEDLSVKQVKPKRVIRNPRPKLNALTLRSSRGIMALEGIFKDVKFKGPGHEEEDLNLMMKMYEYWCNRLFPKYPFEDCIAKIEKLSTKKFVQNYARQIRLGMVDVDDDNEILRDSPEENSDNDNNVNDNNEPNTEMMDISAMEEL